MDIARTNASRSRRRALGLPLALLLGASLLSAAPSTVRPGSSASASEYGQLLLSGETGAATFVTAPEGEVLLALPDGMDAEAGARRFFAVQGHVIGMSLAERLSASGGGSLLHGLGDGGSSLVLHQIVEDELGSTHVRFRQLYSGLEVVGGDLIVHLDERGVTGVSGTFVPDVDVSTVVELSASEAASVALKSVALAQGTREGLRVSAIERKVLRTGLIEGFAGDNRLAWSVMVEGVGVRDEVFVDALQGGILTSFGHVNHAKDRCVYTPIYDPANPEVGRVRTEDSDPTLIPPVDNLYEFAGDTHDFFFAAFGRDSYDAEGAKMISVYLVDAACPNAFWNGTATNYCPGFDLDDVVAHEWGHAYTEYTHDLIYGWQAGALNESYSDIWGETIDLLNGVDGIGGSDNDQPWPDGQRWLLGEDFTEEVQQLLLRDMWNPERLGSPSSVDSAAYGCSTSDQGGVHTNSGVPNHAYAMLVDGKTFDDVTVEGIGLTKAAHIYFRAQSVYQTRATNFPQHAEALAASCRDLIGAPLADLLTAQTTDEVISEDDCVQVDRAMQATGMRQLPERCGFTTNFPDEAPEPCAGALRILDEEFADGIDGWVLDNAGTFPNSWPGFDFSAVAEAPEGRQGALFANDDVAGTCLPGGDYSGSFWADSPAFTIPEGATDAILTFDHFSETELNFDGGNLKVSVNGGDFTLLTAADYLANPPITELAPLEDLNTNPMAGELAYNGGQAGNDVTGTWATSAVDLAALAAPGDEVQLRFEFGMDGCNGTTGWFIDGLMVFSCLLGTGIEDEPTEAPDPAPAPSPEPQPQPEPEPESPPLPVTGGGIAVLGIVSLLGARGLRRRH